LKDEWCIHLSAILSSTLRIELSLSFIKSFGCVRLPPL
jgi:hypothetical protein